MHFLVDSHIYMRYILFMAYKFPTQEAYFSHYGIECVTACVHYPASMYISYPLMAWKRHLEDEQMFASTRSYT